MARGNWTLLPGLWTFAIPLFGGCLLAEVSPRMGYPVVNVVLLY